MKYNSISSSGIKPVCIIWLLYFLLKLTTFEYILFDKFNDTIEDADELIKIARRIPSKINLIEYNPVSGVTLKKSSEQNMLKFMKHLEKNRINARLRRSRGKDIDAACGQLANINHPTFLNP